MNKNICGVIDGKVDVRDYVASAINTAFPKSFELKMVRVKNQKQVNSCVAHVLSSVIEYFNSVQNKDTTEMSVGYIYGNRTNSKHKGQGMILRDALTTVCTYGDVPKELFPYNEEVSEIINKYEEKAEELKETGKYNRLTSYYKLTKEEDIKAALYNGSPVVASVKWYDDITVINNVINTACEDNGNVGNHCILIYGWNEKGWKILNSWGTNWGNQGTAVLPYKVPLREAWGVSDTYKNVNAYGLDIKKPYQSSIGKLIAKCLNVIINLIKK